MWGFSLKFRSACAFGQCNNPSAKCYACDQELVIVNPIHLELNSVHWLPNNCISQFVNSGCDLSILQRSLCYGTQTQADIVIFVILGDCI